MADNTEIVLYIIKTHYNTYYTGITNSLIRRWNEHKAHKSSYLSKFEAKEVVHVEWFETRREAAKKERFIKRFGAFNYMNKARFEAGRSFNNDNFYKLISHGTRYRSQGKQI